MIKSINIALSGLNAASNRLNASASNIANLHTAGALEGEGPRPFTPITTQQTTSDNGGVNSEIVARQQPFTPDFDPDSPFADENGIIGVPNVDLAEESVNLILAKLQYKANIEVIQTASELSDELLNAFDDEA
jgi:flagellar basal-body rod protein FlgC